MKRKQGISLIVLVITIIVMIILAASVVITLSNTGIIDKATHAVNLTDERQVQDLAALIWAEAYLDEDSRENIVNVVTQELEKQGITAEKWDITISETGVVISAKEENNEVVLKEPVLNSNIARFDTIYGSLNGYTSVESYHEMYGEYPVALVRVIESSTLKEARIYVKMDGESDDKYVQRDVKVYPSTTTVSSVSGDTINASAGTYVIIPDLDPNESWVVKVVYEFLDGTVYYVESEPTEIVCFVAGTKVYTENGLMNIEDVKTGMKVYSKNMLTGENELKEVLGTSKRTLRTSTYKVTVAGEVIESTGNHPYYVKDNGFVEASKLKIGDVLVDANGNEKTVSNIEVVNNAEMVTVYNMNVAGNHNYFVSEEMILVHNATACMA